MKTVPVLYPSLSSRREQIDPPGPSLRLSHFREALPDRPFAETPLSHGHYTVARFRYTSQTSPSISITNQQECRNVELNKEINACEIASRTSVKLHLHGVVAASVLAHGLLRNTSHFSLPITSFFFLVLLCSLLLQYNHER